VQTGGAGLVHSRGSVPAAMALLASRVTGARFFYDADGPLSQEYVDAGIWERGSLAYRMTRGLEDHALTRADRVAVLSELRRQEVEPRVARPVTVLPCGIDTARFRRDPVRRTALRQALGLQGLVLVYAGKSGGWYLTEPLLDFAGAVRDVIGPTTLLVLTNDPPDHFATGAARRNLPCIVRSVAPPDMPDHLAAADVGLSFRRPSPSQTAASPIKNGEYLACGLPIVSTAVAGDYPEWLRRDDLGVVVDDLGPRGLEEAARALGRLIADPTLPDRCREMAIRQVDLQGVVIPRYLEIYRELLGPSNALQYGQ
jgi:glycosyltransferase involved in cell wall biosynthesis